MLRHQHFLKLSRLSQNKAKLEKQQLLPSASKGEAEVTEKRPSSAPAFPEPGPQPLEAQSTALFIHTHTLHSGWHVSCPFLMLPRGQNVPASDFLSESTEYA